MPFDPAPKPEITLHAGMRYADFWREVEQMAGRHWNEVGSHRDVLRFLPDHAKYQAAEKMGQLTILTARAEGKLIGYLVVAVMGHLRDRSKRVMVEDLFYVEPMYRRYRVGPKLRDLAESLATQAAITLSRRVVKAHRYQNRPLPRKLRGGYVLAEAVYDKVLTP